MPADFDAALRRIAKAPPDAVIAQPSLLASAGRRDGIDFGCRRSRLPGMFQIKEQVVAGGLMSWRRPA